MAAGLRVGDAAAPSAAPARFDEVEAVGVVALGIFRLQEMRRGKGSERAGIAAIGELADLGGRQNVEDDDGDIDRFINAWLRAGCPRHRNKDIQMDE